MLFVCYPKCTTCQRAKAWLDGQGVSYDQRDIKLDNPTAEELRAWWQTSGLPLKKFFNTSGLQYKVLVAGDGALPTDTTTLKVNYEGKLIDGTVFDSSYQRNQPLTVNMGHPTVIEGWIEVLKLMPAGSKWEVTIPQVLAYGTRDQGVIKSFSTLIFIIEVLK